jgi:uncharacterized protein (DUF486 family)
MNLELILGIVLAFAGGLFWWKQEETKQLISPQILLSISIVLVGAFFILKGLSQFIKMNNNSMIHPQVKNVTVKEWIFILALIFIGSISYTIAAYYHLKLEKWTFLIAFAVALPLILIEYQFSIRGNRAAREILKLSTLQITLITIAFYFINSWMLNYFVMKSPVIWWREIIAFILIFCAFIISTAFN